MTTATAATDLLNADLHCHSQVSDGTLTPEGLAARAAANGVQLWALTDHDEVGGLHRARDAARAVGLNYLTGAEISVTFAGITVHIVGLGFDIDDRALREGLERTRGGREERAREMAASLAQVGIHGAFEGALQYVGNPELISRTHFARHLVATGVCADTSEVFRRFLTEGKPGYVPHRWAKLGDAVRWITQAGGLARDRARSEDVGRDDVRVGDGRDAGVDRTVEREVVHAGRRVGDAGEAALVTRHAERAHAGEHRGRVVPQDVGDHVHVVAPVAERQRVGAAAAAAQRDVDHVGDVDLLTEVEQRGVGRRAAGRPTADEAAARGLHDAGDVHGDARRVGRDAAGAGSALAGEVAGHVEVAGRAGHRAASEAGVDEAAGRHAGVELVGRGADRGARGHRSTGALGGRAGGVEAAQRERSEGGDGDDPSGADAKGHGGAPCDGGLVPDAYRAGRERAPRFGGRSTG